MESEKTKAKEKKLDLFVNNIYTRIIKQCIPQQKNIFEKYFTLSNAFLTLDILGIAELESVGSCCVSILCSFCRIPRGFPQKPQPQSLVSASLPSK